MYNFIQQEINRIYLDFSGYFVLDASPSKKISGEDLEWPNSKPTTKSTKKNCTFDNFFSEKQNNGSFSFNHKLPKNLSQKFIKKKDNKTNSILQKPYMNPNDSFKNLERIPGCNFLKPDSFFDFKFRKSRGWISSTPVDYKVLMPGILHTALLGKYISFLTTTHTHADKTAINAIQKIFPNISNPAHNTYFSAHPLLRNLELVLEGVDKASKDECNTSCEYYVFLRTGLNFLVQFYLNGRDQKKMTVIIGKITHSFKDSEIDSMAGVVSDQLELFQFCSETDIFQKILKLPAQQVSSPVVLEKDIESLLEVHRAKNNTIMSKYFNDNGAPFFKNKMDLIGQELVKKRITARVILNIALLGFFAKFLPRPQNQNNQNITQQIELYKKINILDTAFRSLNNQRNNNRQSGERTTGNDYLTNLNAGIQKLKYYCLPNMEKRKKFVKNIKFNDQSEIQRIKIIMSRLQGLYYYCIKYYNEESKKKSKNNNQPLEQIFTVFSDDKNPILNTYIDYNKSVKAKVNSIKNYFKKRMVKVKPLYDHIKEYAKPAEFWQEDWEVICDKITIFSNKLVAKQNAKDNAIFCWLIDEKMDDISKMGSIIKKWPFPSGRVVLRILLARILHIDDKEFYKHLKPAITSEIKTRGFNSNNLYKNFSTSGIDLKKDMKKDMRLAMDVTRIACCIDYHTSRHHSIDKAKIRINEIKYKIWNLYSDKNKLANLLQQQMSMSLEDFKKEDLIIEILSKKSKARNSRKSLGKQGQGQGGAGQGRRGGPGACIVS